MKFANYGPRKTWLDKCIKSPVWHDHSTSNMGNGPKHWFNLHGSSLYYINWSLWRKSSWEKSLLVTYKVLRLFVNTLTADDNHSLLNRDNSMQIIQMHLSRKQKTLAEFFCGFFKSTSNLEHFQKNMILIAYEFPKLQTPKKMVR